MPSFYLHDNGCDFSRQCRELALGLGFTEEADPHRATVAIAPLLTRKLPVSEYAAPRLGTLIFHPSALPYRRGPDAVRNAVAAGDRVSASTWFWASPGLDEGPICESQPVVLKPGESPGRAYHTRFVPAGLRALDLALRGIIVGAPRSLPQDAELATYDPRLQSA
jgi:methionyl-tRNA formyltransferase